MGIGNAFLTTTSNVFVTFAAPFVIVAVNVTTTSPALYAGRVTCPLLAINSSLFVAHEILDPLAPVVGNSISTVVFVTNSNASLSSCTKSSSVGSTGATGSAVQLITYASGLN